MSGRNNVGTYSFESTVALVNNNEIESFGEGGIVWEPTQSWTKFVGIDGAVARSYASLTGVLNLYIAQTGDSNDILNDLLIEDMVTKKKIVPVSISDPLGRTEIFVTHGWVQKMPQISWLKDISVNQWMIDLGRIDVLKIGGNG